MEQFLSEPQLLHSVLVHIPIGLTIVGIVLVCAAAASSDERKTMRWIAVVCYLIAAIVAYAAGFQGASAREQISGALPNPVWAAISHHEYLGRQIWKFSLATAGLLALSTAPWAWLRSLTITLAIGVSAATAAWTGVAAYSGAQLVYHHGLGVPAQVEPLVSPLANRADAPGSALPKTQQMRTNSTSPEL